MPCGRARGASRTWLDVGEIESLCLRPNRAEPLAAVSTVFAEAGIGLNGDCHADPLSPRQILLACAGSYRRFDLPAGTLRENITVSCDLREWCSGSLVSLGTRATLRVTFECEPCARLNAHRPGLMRAVRHKRGILARVVRGGTISVGDCVRIQPAQRAWWSDVWQERVRDIAARVPCGFVVEYRQLARLAGVPVSYCRVFPRVLATEGVGTRVVSSQTECDLPRWTGEELFAPLKKLRREAQTINA